MRNPKKNKDVKFVPRVLRFMYSGGVEYSKKSWHTGNFFTQPGRDDGFDWEPFVADERSGKYL